ncbi:hypothetical protein HZB88_04265 [archaeon]|nr:hypothetical protein [archaeon]
MEPKHADEGKREKAKEILKELLNISEVARKITSNNSNNIMYSQLIMHSCEVIKDIIVNEASPVEVKDKIRNLNPNRFEIETKSLLQRR